VSLPKAPFLFSCEFDEFFFKNFRVWEFFFVISKSGAVMSCSSVFGGVLVFFVK
jgi:hypothetical protein